MSTGIERNNTSTLGVIISFMGLSEKSRRESIISLSAGRIWPSISPSAVKACISASVTSASSSSGALTNFMIRLVIPSVNGANIFDKTSTKKVVLDKNDIGSFVARVFGVISPKIKTITVVKTVAIALPALSPKRRTKISVATDAINIFTKLLPTNIPPIVFSIFSLALLILLFFLFSSNWCIFWIGIEVIAVSEPDSMPDRIRQRKNTMYKTMSKLILNLYH